MWSSNNFKLSKRSMEKLTAVHPQLVAVMLLAIKLTPIDFSITEGWRTAERQRQLFELGATKTLNSRHLTGHAVDVAAWVGREVRWDWPLYSQIAVAVKRAADKLQTPIVWGGDWQSFPDGPHFELSREFYK